MQAIVNALQFVLDKIVGALEWLGLLAAACFLAAWDFLRDVFCWAFESCLLLVVTILGAFDFSGLASYAGTWAGLPDMTLEVLSAVGLSTAVGIVVSAIGIRLALQLVPFTRLGS